MGQAEARTSQQAAEAIIRHSTMALIIQVEGKKLTDVINRTHENSRYLPDIKLPRNLVAVPHLKDVVKDATLIVVCVPHQVRESAVVVIRAKLIF